MDSAFSSGPSYTSHNFSKLMHEIGNFGHAAQFLFLKNTVYRKKLLYSPSCIISLKPKSKKFSVIYKYSRFIHHSGLASVPRCHLLWQCLSVLCLHQRLLHLLRIRHFEQFQQGPNCSKITL